MSRETIDTSYLQDLLQKAGIHLPKEGLQKLWTYHTYLREKNPELNLTRIHNFESMVRKHYVDSLIILNILKDHNIKLPERIMDLGTGPGLPGIPLAIAKPDIHIILAEGRLRRVEFLKKSVEILKLQNASVLGAKVHSGTECICDAVITRAVESMKETALRVLQCFETSGMLIFMKGPNCSEEIEEVLQSKRMEAKLLLDESYNLPGSDDSRRLVVFEIRSKEYKPKTFKITSADNSKFKIWKSLNSGRMVRKHQLTLASGARVIDEFKDSSLIDAILVDEKNPVLNFQTESPVFELSHNLFLEVDFFGTGSSILVLKYKDILPFDPEDAPGISLIAPLGDPENLGAVIRSAAAFDVDRIVLTRESANPYHPRAIRASAGYIHDIEIRQIIDYKKMESPVYLLEKTGSPINDIIFPETMILVIGSEGQGIPQEFNGKSVSIPISDSVESLNAAVAASIALFSIQQSRKQR